MRSAHSFVFGIVRKPRRHRAAFFSSASTGRHTARRAARAGLPRPQTISSGRSGRRRASSRRSQSRSSSTRQGEVKTASVQQQEEATCLNANRPRPDGRGLFVFYGVYLFSPRRIGRDPDHDPDGPNSQRFMAESTLLPVALCQHRQAFQTTSRELSANSHWDQT